MNNSLASLFVLVDTQHRHKMMIRLLPIFLGYAAVAHRDVPTKPLEMMPSSVASQRNVSSMLMTMVGNLKGGDQLAAFALLSSHLEEEPDNIKALNEAIDDIIEDFVNAHKASQKLIDTEIDAYVNCRAMPLVDTDANENAANKFLLIAPAQKEQDDASTGEIDYDFGEDATQSAIAAAGVKTAIDAYKKVFDDAYNRRETAQSNYDAAQEASDKADETKKAAAHQCYCAARKAYEDVKKSVEESNKNVITNLKHFQMIQCVMAEFAKGNKEGEAFNTCGKKTFDDKAEEIDYREKDAELDSSIVCEGEGSG